LKKLPVENIHTTAVAIDGAAVLLVGSPGSGKSDLALRLIMDKGAVLIADDRADIAVENYVLKVSCPKSIKGLLEVRGVGICKFPYLSSARVKLVVKMASSISVVERLPSSQTTDFLGIKIPTVEIWPFEASAPDKILAACYKNQ
jgi:serine kinase of HPr protein (carbohydrate metabolism regulator)